MSDPAASKYSTARQHMVESQLQPNEVNNEAVVKAMGAVAREVFVPKALRATAYVDEDLPLGSGRFLMEPRVFGRLIQAAAITKESSVLDIGCATGYSAAVLSKMANSVVAVDDSDFAAQAEKNLAVLDIHNVAVVAGKLDEGVQGQGHFDVIIVEGAISDVPQALLNLLEDGGRLLCVKLYGVVGRAHMVTRRGDAFSPVDLFDAAVEALPGMVKEVGFVF